MKANKKKLDLDISNLISDIIFLFEFTDTFNCSPEQEERLEKIRNKIKEYNYRYEK